jgi:hypothetical protein
LKEMHLGAIEAAAACERSLPGSPGDIATVVASGCGPPTTPEEQRNAASTFVGEQRLFVGNIDAGSLVAFTQVITPTGVSPREQYTLASSLAHHEPLGTQSERPGWLVPAGVLAAMGLALGLLAASVRRRSRVTTGG